MKHVRIVVRCGLLLVFIVVFCLAAVASADPLKPLEARIITDSETLPWDRRVYSYDMGVDASGNIHIVYLKPTSGSSGDIVYSRRVSGVWSEQTLTSSGLKGSISTRLLVDSSGKVHISYIKNDEHLYYRTATDGVPSSEIKVSDGAWHTRMQLGDNGRAMFVRELNLHSEKKLVLLTTVDAVSWHSTDVNNQPDVNKVRIGEFVYDSGVYHLTYGDAVTTKAVINYGPDGIFHNFHYASSVDGVNWTHSVIDTSQTLYENEFWTSLIVDNGTPVVAMYKYAEYGGKYNTGTSVLLATWDGNLWQTQNITPASYPDTREGMGVGLVQYAPGDYFAGWDFSPDNTHDDDYRGERGNIALARSGTDGSWSTKWQIDEFSAEGEVKLQINNNRLYLLALGDYVDAKLYFREYDMALFSSPSPPFPPISPSFGNIMAPIGILLLGK